jgi:hypothetical protein
MKEIVMPQRWLFKQLCFFLIVSLAIVSCERKAAQTGEPPNLTAISNSEETDATEESIHQSEVKPDIDYSKDAIENGINLDNINDVLLISVWTALKRSWIGFKWDNTYLLSTAPEGDWFGEGVYRVEGNDVVLEYPFKTMLGEEGLSVDTMEWLFEGENPTVLTYDKSYRDFNVLTCLRHGDKKLISYAIKSPVWEEYELDGFQVVKYPEQESRVLILENLKMRKFPEITADTVMLGRWMDIPWDIIRMNKLDDTVTMYPLGISIVSDVVYTDMLASFNAKTVKKDTIDGITAPWYRLNIVLNDFDSAYVWVFGGYLRELSPTEIENGGGVYYQKYIQSLIDNGIIDWL